MGYEDNWFSVEEIDHNTYAISEYKHWEETHCYLICGTQRALLIDTGLGISDIRTVVERLTDLPILVVTTHVHWDHIGGHSLFENIAVYEKEVSWLAEKFPLPIQVVKHNLTCRDCEFPDSFCLEEYQIFQGMPQKIIYDGECIDLGNRKVEVIHTPGHSPGHCCFYETERKYLYSGDLIYKGCLDAFYPTTDPVLFYESVRRIQKYQISRILPGHHQLHIDKGIVDEIARGFSMLEKNGKLHQGNGLFDFGDFQIHV